MLLWDDIMRLRRKAGSGIDEKLGGQSLRCLGEMAKSDESCLLVVLVGGGGDIRRPARWPAWSR